MKPQKVVISSPELKRRAIAIIEALQLEPASVVEIKEYKRTRSLEANALYWKWLTVIGAELGESKEALAEQMKDKFLVQIYERDNEEYAEMVQALRAVWKQGMKQEAVSLRKKIVALTSTTTATTSQMSEYMTCIEHWAHDLGIRLPFPDEMYV